MFSFGLKGSTAEVIKRGAHARFLGDYIDKKWIPESEFNDEAKAYNGVNNEVRFTS